jgi:parallel beta-helix repeat protein
MKFLSFLKHQLCCFLLAFLLLNFTPIDRCGPGNLAFSNPTLDGTTAAGQTFVIAPSADVQYQLQELIIRALPGDIIQLEEGVYELQSQLDVAVDNFTLRGRGSNKTILSFKRQASGGQGIEATGNNLLMEGFAVEDTTGNAIKVVGARNVTFRDVRAEWTGPASVSNGAYGIYPVQCQNVLMENCSAYGASDAGLYVGQCHDVVVRGCRAERNVAGIEIENTVNADVYSNVATNNAGGLLVFDLPGLQVKNGRNIRLFNNHVYENNHENFADPGGIVSTVPSGTGVMVLATDAVEVFGNRIEDNQTVSVLVVSYLAVGRRINDPDYDPIPHGVAIIDNSIVGGGRSPQGAMAAQLGPVLGQQFSEIMWDGITKEKAAGPALVISGNGDASFCNFNFSKLSPENVLSGKYSAERDATKHSVSFDRLPPVELRPHGEVSSELRPASLVYQSFPKKLSEYGLFSGPLRNHRPADGVYHYDLNAELFSDYSTKRRFIQLPPGSPMVYREEGVFDFPLGTVIAKTFSYPHDFRDPSLGERFLETRIEMLKDTGWYAASYIWNEDQTEATLSLGGADTLVHWIADDGNPQSIRYQIPNVNQCITCHNQEKQFIPIGPTAQNLNRLTNDYGTTVNQLAKFVSFGVLEGLPALDAEVPQWPDLKDPHSGSVAQRARAWLDVNCAHCHSPAGSARTSGLDLRWQQVDLAKAGLWKTPVAAGPGSGGRKFGIVPGKSHESILMYRLESDDPKAMMPNVGRTLVHDAGVELVRRWIDSLPVEQ